MMSHSTLPCLLRILGVTLLGASSCSAFINRILKTNTHCILVDGNALCPGQEYHIASDFVTITAGFPDNSKAITTWKPYWEETLWIGTHSALTLPNFDQSMKHIFFGDDSCLYGNVGFGEVTFNAQLIKCVNQHYVGNPYPNPWATRNYGPLVATENLDLSDPAHNKKGTSIMDYRGLPQREGDPDNVLPAYSGPNPLLHGVHQDSQWGNPNPSYPKSAPPVYDTTAPPLSYPPSKIRPIRPYPAPGVDIENMPNVYEMEPFLPPCPKGKPDCNKRKTPEEIRLEGSLGNPNTNVATTDSSAISVPATVDGSNGAAVTTDGTAGGDTTATESSNTDTTATESSNTDTTVPAAGKTVASADGTSAASTDGISATSIDGTSAASADGRTVAPTDGTAPSTDGITTSTDTTAATLPIINTADSQDLTAQAVPGDDTLFGKKSRRSFLHPRSFRVQMR